MSINISGKKEVDAHEKVTGIYVEYNGGLMKSIKLLYNGEKPESLNGHPNSIGTYFAPTPAAKKLEGFGSVDGGEPWDDGAFYDVQKVCVALHSISIGAVKFTYANGAKVVQGNEYGELTLMGYEEEFVLNYPSEYITAVDGTYDKIHGSNFPVITMLRFTTNMRQSEPFGADSGTPFTLKQDGHKIVGFHGKSSKLLHNLGVYVLPIDN